MAVRKKKKILSIPKRAYVFMIVIGGGMIQY